jgi:tetratricopeptide (TPR) repeat protein
MVGIIEEQHPDRAQLFMQWKQMGWPVMVDSLNLLNVPYVPITLEIDEGGVIRFVDPRFGKPSDIQENFLGRVFQSAVVSTPALPAPPDLEKLRRAATNGTATAWGTYADALVLWGGQQRLGEALAAYKRALELVPREGHTHFRLGVAYRKRYDSSYRQPGDFQMAVEQWQAALDTDPNQYIWRRRIEQYGPRLHKPYPFYDWVETARREITARGETPVPLQVEPRGSEFASPTERFELIQTSVKEPDPLGRILRDEGKLVTVETTVVPPEVAPGGSTRVHMVFRPNPGTKAHWNNEVDGLRLWINAEQGWQANSHLFALPNPPQTISRETRTLELELLAPAQSAPGTYTLRAYALYYVCEDVNGTCLYRRQDIPFQIKVRQGVH